MGQKQILFFCCRYAAGEGLKSGHRVGLMLLGCQLVSLGAGWTPPGEQEDRAHPGRVHSGPLSSGGSWRQLGNIGIYQSPEPLQSCCSPGGLCLLQWSLCQEPGLRVLPHPPDCHPVSVTSGPPSAI